MNLLDSSEELMINSWLELIEQKGYAGLDDEYIFRNMPFHLTHRKKWPEAERQLTDFEFVEAKVLCLKDSVSIIQDYDLAIAIPSSWPDPILQRLREMRWHLWTEASALSKVPSCVTQQLTNRMRWSSPGDNYWRNQADQAVQRCRDAGRPLFRTLLPNSASHYRTQRILGSEVEDTIGMAMIGCDLALWSKTGKLRVLKHLDSVIHNEENLVPAMPLQQLTGKENVLVAASGRVIHYWEMRPEKKLTTQTLRFTVLQVALAYQGHDLVVIGHNGEWARYSFRSGNLEECRIGQLSSKGTCCAMSSSGEYWAMGTRTGQVFFCNDTEQREIAQHAGAVRAVAIDPVGNGIASGGQDGVLRLTALDGSVIHLIECNGWINDITFSADGKKMFWVTESGQLFSLAVDSPLKAALVWMSENMPLEHICLLPAKSETAEPENEFVAAVLASDHRVRLVEFPQDTSTWRSPLSSDIHYIAPWRDGSSVLAIDLEDNRFIIDLDSSPPRAKRLSEPAGAVAASALLEGQLITVYQDLGQSRITRQGIPVLRTWQEKALWLRGLWWKMQSLLFNPRVTSAEFTYATFSPDLQTVVVVRTRSASDKRIEAYDTTTLKKFFERDWNSPDCRTMAISNKAKYILVASLLHSPPQLIVSDSPSGNTIDLPPEGCQGAAFSGTGSELLVIDRGGKAWFFQGSLQGERFEDLGDGMVCCDLSSDARWILLGNSDGQVILIDRAAVSESLKVRRAFLPWKASYCQVYPQMQWVVLGGHGNLQVLKWN